MKKTFVQIAWIIQAKLQNDYDRKFKTALERHNKDNPDQEWKKMKKGYSRTIFIPGIDPHGGFTQVTITVWRIQISGMRGKGATFTFLGDMFLPRSHFLASQAAEYLLSYLRRKDKSMPLSAWVYQMPEVELSSRMLKTAFRAVCRMLQISFGDRPSKLYRLATYCRCLAEKIQRCLY